MIDLSIILIMIVFGVVGYKKGFIRSITTLCSSIIALILSFIIYPIVNMLLKLTPIYTSIYQGVFKKIEIIDFGKGIQSQGNAILENITWLPDFLTMQIKNNNNTAMYELLGAATIQEYISSYVTHMIMSMLALLITWILLKVVLGIVFRILGSIIENLPVMSSLNRCAGLFFGLLKGVIALSILSLIVPLLITSPVFENISQSIEGSILIRWLYENNFILIMYNYFI